MYPSKPQRDAVQDSGPTSRAFPIGGLRPHAHTPYDERRLPEPVPQGVDAAEDPAVGQHLALQPQFPRKSPAPSTVRTSHFDAPR